MDIFDYRSIKNEIVEEGAKETKIRWLISKERGAKNYEMRLFEVGSGGYTPLHSHNWEHEVFVLEGDGIVKSNDKEIGIKAGSVVFVTPNELHQFVNNGKEILKFICVIPARK